MNLGTAIIGTALAGLVLLIIKSMIKDKMNGKPVTGCGGDCSKCHGCH